MLEIWSLPISELRRRKLQIIGNVFRHCLWSLPISELRRRKLDRGTYTYPNIPTWSLPISELRRRKHCDHPFIRKQFDKIITYLRVKETKTACLHDKKCFIIWRIITYLRVKETKTDLTNWHVFSLWTWSLPISELRRRKHEIDRLKLTRHTHDHYLSPS